MLSLTLFSEGNSSGAAHRRHRNNSAAIGALAVFQKKQLAHNTPNDLGYFAVSVLSLENSVVEFTQILEMNCLGSRLLHQYRLHGNVFTTAPSKLRKIFRRSETRDKREIILPVWNLELSAPVWGVECCLRLRSSGASFRYASQLN